MIIQISCSQGLKIRVKSDCRRTSGSFLGWWGRSKTWLWAWLHCTNVCIYQSLPNWTSKRVNFILYLFQFVRKKETNCWAVLGREALSFSRSSFRSISSTVLLQPSLVCLVRAGCPLPFLHLNQKDKEEYKNGESVSWLTLPWAWACGCIQLEEDWKI